MGKKQGSKSNTNASYISPYKLPRRSVQLEHFLDARLYDPTINDEGWTVPIERARKEYLKWLKYVRSHRGWENFRRSDQSDKSNQSNRYDQSNLVSSTEVSMPQRYYTKSMGKYLKDRREEIGLRSEDLAKLINVNPSLIMGIENSSLMIPYDPADLLTISLAGALHLPLIEYIE